MKKGYFITLEGGEGSGKSTLISQLVKYLSDSGYQVISTREPGGSQLGNEIRHLLLNKLTRIVPKAELLLFLASRAQHIEELIKPALATGKIVLCDRFNDSTIAYQGAARGFDGELKQLCDFTCGSIQPNLTLFLDVDPEIGLHRTKKHALKGDFDRIEEEKIEFHHKVREGFLLIAKNDPKRVHRIDANHSQEEVFTEAKRIIDKNL